MIEHKKDISSLINPTEKNFSHYLKSAIQADYSLNLLNLTRAIALDKLFLSEEEFSNQNFFAHYSENLEDTFLRVFTTHYYVDFLHTAFDPYLGNKTRYCTENDYLYENGNIVQKLGNDLIATYKIHCFKDNVIKSKDLREKFLTLFKLCISFDNERKIISNGEFFKLLHLHLSIQMENRSLSEHCTKHYLLYKDLLNLLVSRIIKNSPARFVITPLKMDVFSKLYSFVNVLFDNFFETNDFDTWLKNFNLADKLAKETKESETRYSIAQLLKEIDKCKNELHNSRQTQNLNLPDNIRDLPNDVVSITLRLISDKR